jgi:hypothetical protein
LRLDAFADVDVNGIVKMPLDLVENPLAACFVDSKIGVDVVEVPVDRRLVKHRHPPAGNP